MQLVTVLCKPGIPGFPQESPLGDRTEIPVENHGFSTFSTGLSTRVFHNDAAVVE
jgi:hypothetical protein